MGLPPGHGSVAQGRDVFAQRCAACHGDKGQGGPADIAWSGGFGTLSDRTPIKTVVQLNCQPYATTLFDFVRRAMPFNAPGTLSDDEIYAVSAYILALNGVIADDATLGPDNLSHIAMPNRNGLASAKTPARCTMTCHATSLCTPVRRPEPRRLCPPCRNRSSGREPFRNRKCAISFLQSRLLGASVRSGRPLGEKVAPPQSRVAMLPPRI